MERRCASAFAKSMVGEGHGKTHTRSSSRSYKQDRPPAPCADAVSGFLKFNPHDRADPGGVLLRFGTINVTARDII
jgi:hypothetical protein